MSKTRASAKSAARQHGRHGFWLDHAAIVEDDFAWLASAERLTLWNVHVPPGFLARLERLWWLDIRGGTARDLSVARGAANLRYLAVTQVRGMRDLSAIGQMLRLRYIDLYGLPHVTTLPSCRAHAKLERATLGQMQGLRSLAGLLDAPKLRQLQLVKKTNVSAQDIERIANHRTIEQFGWFAEDVPNKVWMPVVTKVALPPVPYGTAEDWFGVSKDT